MILQVSSFIQPHRSAVNILNLCEFDAFFYNDYVLLPSLYAWYVLPFSCLYLAILEVMDVVEEKSSYKKINMEHRTSSQTHYITKR